MADSESPFLLAGEKTVATSGTAVALGSRKVVKVEIRAKSANTGQIYVGGSDVDTTTNDGLDAAESLVLEHPRAIAFDLADIYLDADANGEGVDFYAIKA